MLRWFRSHKLLGLLMTIGIVINGIAYVALGSIAWNSLASARRSDRLELEVTLIQMVIALNFGLLAWAVGSRSSSAQEAPKSHAASRPRSIKMRIIASGIAALCVTVASSILLNATMKPQELRGMMARVAQLILVGSTSGLAIWLYKRHRSPSDS